MPPPATMVGPIMQWLYLTFSALLLVASPVSAEERLILPVEGEELASHMVELQVLTHKLGLSIDAKNLPLIEFYLHESLVKLEEIQTIAPEYEGSPIAVYIDHIAKPAYVSLDEAIDSAKDKSDLHGEFKLKYEGILQSCNVCHASCGRAEIVIQHNSFNPYLQNFSVRGRTED